MALVAEFVREEDFMDTVDHNAENNAIEELSNEIFRIEQRRKSLEPSKWDIKQSDPFVISFVGKFKAGKSSLINVLLDGDLLPTRATTATSVVTHILYGQTAKACVRKDGSTSPVTIEQAQEIILYDSDKEGGDISDVYFYLPIPWLKGELEIRDTPGLFDSAMEGMLEEVTHDTINNSDLIIFVCDAGSFLSNDERMIIEEIHQEKGGNIVFVINRTNLLNSEEEFEEVEQKAKRLFQQYGNHIVGLDRQFMVCSAPRMADLDGFDVWFQEQIIDNRAIWGMLRDHRCAAEAEKEKLEIRESVGRLQERIEAKLADTVQKHKKILDEGKRKAKAVGKDELDALKALKEMQRSDFLDSERLEFRLNGLTRQSEWKTTYKERSKEVVKEYYEDKVSELSHLEHYPKEFNRSFARRIIDEASFPGCHSVSVKSDGVTTGIVGAVGGLFGFLVGGPVGAAVGAGLGAAVSGTENVDDSASNTYHFVQNEIVPKLKEGYDREMDRCIEIRRRASQKEAENCQSGLELSVERLGQLKERASQLASLS